MPKHSLEVVSKIMAKAGSPTFNKVSSKAVRCQGFLVEENAMPPFELEPAEAPFPMAGMVISPSTAKWNWQERGRDYQADFHPENILTVPKGSFPRQWWKVPVTILSVSFEPAFVSEAVYGSEQKGQVEFLASPTGTDSVATHLFWALHHELKTGFPGGRLIGESIGSALAAAVTRRFSACRTPPGGGKHGLEKGALNRVVEYIHEHLDFDLGLEELAGIALMSRFHFCREFKVSTGHSVHRFVLLRRIERAKLLLKETDLPLADVGFQSGLVNPSHFTAVFRRFVGVTPGSYRRVLCQ